MPKWKNGDAAACRECVGYRVSYTYPECGCTAMVTPEAATKKKTHCWNCYQQWYRENEPRIKAELSTAAKAAAGRAAELLDAVPLPEDMPAPLATESRWWASKHLQGAIAAEEVLGKEGAREEMLSSVSAMGARLLPSKEDAGRAAAHDGVLRLLDQAHWAEGWLHVRTGRAARPVPEKDLEGVAIMLGNILADWSQRAAASVARDRANGHRRDHPEPDPGGDLLPGRERDRPDREVRPRLPRAAFNHPVTWLRKNRVLLPGVSVLARQVSEAHHTHRARNRAELAVETRRFFHRRQREPHISFTRSAAAISRFFSRPRSVPRPAAGSAPARPSRRRSTRRPARISRTQSYRSPPTAVRRTAPTSLSLFPQTCRPALELLVRGHVNYWNPACTRALTSADARLEKAH
ncbi:hypothetical protein AB0D66_30795 [Streptomyces sp. NPDC048270]|uniref:hypothetical protein n=1 Tax=Streptomyces sp. NPDC048270 TaxID=3154615 RepID=UPI0033DA3F24